MNNNNPKNKSLLRPAVAPKIKATGQIFLKLHVMPQVSDKSLRRWWILGLLATAVIVVSSLLLAYVF